MKLTYFRGDEPNFGDELNATMWRSLLPPDFLDEDDSELFLGIGSILWDYHPPNKIKHVMGSGYGGYTPPPNVKDGSWTIAWLRGPLTAARLGVDARLAITDAAILVRATPLPAPAAGVGAAFMPHFESTARGNWAEVCRLAGVTYLDPRDDPQRLIAQIRGASVLVTEAMHGAIVADALRTPFIAITPAHPMNRAKWLDWAQSVQLDLRRTDLAASSLREAYVKVTGLRGQGARSRALFDSPLLAPLQRSVVHRAASKLQRIAERTEPQLSADATMEQLTSRCLEALHRFVTTRSQSQVTS